MVRPTSTRRPTAAGVLTIVSGVFIVWYRTGEFIRLAHPSGAFSSPHVFSLVGPAIGLVAVAGGTFAIRRQRWGLAVAGAICAVFPPHPWGWFIWTPILGVVAISSHSQLLARHRSCQWRRHRAGRDRVGSAEVGAPGSVPGPAASAHRECRGPIRARRGPQPAHPMIARLG